MFKVDWTALAKGYGYVSYKDMLEDLYLKDELTMQQIADRLKVSTFTVKRHLDTFGIQIRKPGGAQNVAHKKWVLFRLDPRVFWNTSNTDLERVLHIDKSTIYKWKREIFEHADGNHFANRRTGTV